MTNNETYISYLKAHNLQVPIAKLPVWQQKEYRKHLEQTDAFIIYSAIADFADHVN